MDTQTLARQAVQEALSQNWQKAVESNSQVLLLEPDNIDALNRLGRAYVELGDKKVARKLFKKVLKLDALNTIAKKNLENLKKRGFAAPKLPLEDGQAFVKQPGMDTIAEITTTASPLRIRKLAPGDILTLEKRRKKFSVFGPKNLFLGHITNGLSEKMQVAVKKKALLSGTFVSSSESKIKFIVKGSTPIFKGERQEVRPYVLPEELPEQSELEQTTLEEQTEKESAEPLSGETTPEE